MAILILNSSAISLPYSIQLIMSELNRDELPTYNYNSFFFQKESKDGTTWFF